MVEHRHGKVEREAALRHKVHEQKHQPAPAAAVAEGEQQHALDEQRRQQHTEKLQQIGGRRTRRARGPFRPVHPHARLQRRAVQRIGYPAFAAFCHENDPIRIRYAMVAEGVEPHPACVAADQVAPHGRAVGALRGAGVPALRHRCPQRVQQLVIQRGDFLLGVAPIQPAVCVISVSGAIGVPLIIPLFQKIEVVRLARRVFDLHRQLGLRPRVGKGRYRQQHRRQQQENTVSQRLFHFFRSFPFPSCLFQKQDLCIF